MQEFSCFKSTMTQKSMNNSLRLQSRQSTLPSESGLKGDANVENKAKVMIRILVNNFIKKNKEEGGNSRKAKKK